MAAKKATAKICFYLDQKTLEKYEGLCIGLKDNEVVASGKNAGKVLKDLMAKGRGEEITLACVPKRNAAIVRKI